MINIELFKLFGSIFIKDDEANKKLDKVDKKAESIASKLGKMGKTAAKWGAAIGAGATAAGGALLAMANKTAATTDRIDKLSQKIGMSRQGFQEWEFILSQSGTSIENMQMGMKTLGLRIDELNKGTGEGAELFKQFGLSVEQVNSMSQEELFETLVLKLQEMEDGTQKAIIANKLFGRSGQELMPLLNAQAGSIEELKNKAHELGLVIGDEAIDAGVKFTDTMDQMKRAAGTLFTQIGTSLMPIFQKFLEWVLANMPTIKEIFSTVFTVISTVVTKVFEIFNDYILPVLKTVYDFIKTNWPQIKEIAIAVFTPIWEIVKRLWGIFNDSLLPILKDLYDFVKPTFPIIAKIVEGAFKTIIGIANGLITVFDKVIGTVKKVIDWFKRFKKSKPSDTSITTTQTTTVQYKNMVPGLATGGVVARSGTVLVGEKGPELLDLPKGARVTPLDKAGNNITIQINNPKLFNERDADRLGELVVRRLRTLGVT